MYFDFADSPAHDAATYIFQGANYLRLVNQQQFKKRYSANDQIEIE